MTELIEWLKTGGIIIGVATGVFTLWDRLLRDAPIIELVPGKSKLGRLKGSLQLRVINTGKRAVLTSDFECNPRFAEPISDFDNIDAMTQVLVDVRDGTRTQVRLIVAAGTVGGINLVPFPSGFDGLKDTDQVEILLHWSGANRFWLCNRCRYLLWPCRHPAKVAYSVANIRQLLEANVAKDISAE